MKNLSIKLKITIWFTTFMVLLSAISFVFIIVVSQSTSTNQTRSALTDLVDSNADEVEYDDDELEIDDDFISYKNGIYCMIFREDGTKINGYSPYTELEDASFEHMSIRTINIDGDTYLIYDRLTEFKQYDNIWIRGYVSTSSATYSSMTSAVVVVLPLLIILASVGGYLIAKRLLRPIEHISETAHQISNDGDLSKRIELGNNGDELYKLAVTFNRMFDRLEMNFDAERHFTSDASHELRTPVSIILANCEYAFENASDKEELYEAIGAIQKQGYRMSHLIESLLEFTRLEQKTEDITLNRIDLSSIVLSVVNELKQLSDKNIALSGDVQAGIMMNADFGLFSRMLENLIQNAYKYGKENGNIDVILKENNNEITLCVEDDGIGIASSEQPKIWSRFYRADKSRNTSKGLGLGLAMVKQIAALHNGEIDVESELGKGSIFTIKFTKA